MTRLVFIACLIGIFSSGAQAMGSKVMFSAVVGQVVQGGKPVAGAKVVRQYVWQWDGQKVQEETETDAAGKFSFAEASKSSLAASLLPFEPVINQTIHIFWGGKKYLAWRHTKHNYEKEGELQAAIQIVCELDSEAEFYISPNVFGICR